MPAPTPKPPFLAALSTLLAAVLCLVVVVGQSLPEANAAAAPSAAAATAASTLDCRMRKYSYKVEKSDSAGRRCWDSVAVMSCWGRCDSREISDWRFPYKRAFHPVCLHGSRQLKTATLRNCEAGVEPGTDHYEVLEALSCRCSVCKSSEASCEGMRARGRRAPALASEPAPALAFAPAPEPSSLEA